MKDEKRKQRLAELLTKMENGQDIASRDVKSMLTAEEYEKYQEHYASIKSIEADSKIKPDAVIEYEKLLKQAQFAYNRAEGYAKKDSKSKDGSRTATRWYSKAETAFARALERLEELVGFDSQLESWFDRPLYFGNGTDLGPSPGSMPIPKSSRSTDNLKAGNGTVLMSKRQSKQHALENALQVLTDDERLASRTLAEVAKELAQADVIERQSQSLLKFARRRR